MKELLQIFFNQKELIGLILFLTLIIKMYSDFWGVNDLELKFFDNKKRFNYFVSFISLQSILLSFMVTTFMFIYNGIEIVNNQVNTDTTSSGETVLDKVTFLDFINLLVPIFIITVVFLSFTVLFGNLLVIKIEFFICDENNNDKFKIIKIVNSKLLVEDISNNYIFLDDYSDKIIAKRIDSNALIYRVLYKNQWIKILYLGVCFTFLVLTFLVFFTNKYLGIKVIALYITMPCLLQIILLYFNIKNLKKFNF